MWFLRKIIKPNAHTHMSKSKSEIAIFSDLRGGKRKYI